MTRFVFYITIGPSCWGGLDILDAKLIPKSPVPLARGENLYFPQCEVDAPSWDEARADVLAALADPQWEVPVWYRGKLTYFLTIATAP